MSTLAAILKKDPEPMSEMAPAVPHELEKIIKRCLRKDPTAAFNIWTTEGGAGGTEGRIDSGKLAGTLSPRASADSSVLDLGWELHSSLWRWLLRSGSFAGTAQKPGAAPK